MDSSALDIMGVLTSATAQGPGADDDTAVTVTATVLEVDASEQRVRVSLRGGDLWLPAVAGLYSISGTCRVLVNPTLSRAVLVLGPAVPRPGVGIGLITAGPTGGNLEVSFEGVDGIIVPAPTGAYTVGGSAWLILDQWGAPVLAVGPSGDPGSGGPSGGGGGGGGGAIVAATTTIGPQSSGTWRASKSAWDTWGNGIHGGVADIYQGSGYGSGALTGLACFGDQIVNLGALSITKMTLTARRNGSGTGSAALTVQGAPHGTRPGGAPSPSGTTASTPGAAMNATVSVDLPADVCEAFRTGAAKSLAAVGGTYAGFGGTSTPGSFTLAIQYTRNA